MNALFCCLGLDFCGKLDATFLSRKLLQTLPPRVALAASSGCDYSSPCTKRVCR